MNAREIVKSLTFTTPAFLSGADQNVPEIRAPSIRGALRWWFRVLGGSREDEAALFGTVHGGVRASAVVVRVEDVKITDNAKAPSFRPESPLGYLGYFAAVSGNKIGVRRTEGGHYIGAGSTFTLRVTARRAVAPALWVRLEETVEAFCRLGALGLRATRGFGMVAEASPPTAAAFRAWAQPLGARGIHLWECAPMGGAHQTLSETLRGLRRSDSAQLGGGQESALGYSLGKRRHASALRLCPVCTADAAILPVLLYTDNAASAASCLEAVRAYFRAPDFVALT